MKTLYRDGSPQSKKTLKTRLHGLVDSEIANTWSTRSSFLLDMGECHLAWLTPSQEPLEMSEVFVSTHKGESSQIMILFWLFKSNLWELSLFIYWIYSKKFEVLEQALFLFAY